MIFLKTKRKSGIFDLETRRLRIQALFGEINSRKIEHFSQGRMQISGREVVHKGIKISGQNLVRRRVSWFCINGLRRNVGTITGYDDSPARLNEPFDFENDEVYDGRNKTNKLVPLDKLYDCHVVEDARSPDDLRAFEIEGITMDPDSINGCDLVGLEHLWRVALEAIDDGVASRACEMMLGIAHHLADQFIYDMLRRVFREIPEGGHGKSQGIRGRICRALSLLQTFLNAEVPNTARRVMPHSFSRRGASVTAFLSRSAKKARAHNATCQKLGDEEEKIELHGNMTLKEMEELVSLRMGLESGTFELQLGETTLSGRGRTIQSLGLFGRVELVVVATSRGPKEERSHVLLREKCTTMAAMAVTEDESVDMRFEALLGVLAAHEGKDEALLEQVWNVLTLLPTQPMRLQRVQQALEQKEEAAWEHLFGKSCGVWLSVYQLQVLDALLIPRRLARDDFGELQRKFIEGGGACAVVALLPVLCAAEGAWCHPERLSWQESIAAVLRILSLALHSVLGLSMGTSGDSSPESSTWSGTPAKTLGGRETQENAGVLIAKIPQMVTLLLDAVIMVSQREPPPGNPTVFRPVLLEVLALLNVLIRNLEKIPGTLSDSVIASIFQPVSLTNDRASRCEMLVAGLLVGGADATVRLKAMSLLLDIVCAGVIKDSGDATDNRMTGTVQKLLKHTMLAAADSQLAPTMRPASPEVRGSDCFEFACRLVNMQVRERAFVQADDVSKLLTLCLELICGTRPGFECPSGSVATGLLRFLNVLLQKLPPAHWAPLVRESAGVIFKRYLMASDPAGAPKLGWPDDAGAAETRQVGWDALLQVTVLSGDAQAGLLADEWGLESLAWLVDEALALVEDVPQQASPLEEVDQVESFDPSHNPLRHSRGLVGLKNRRNTCYINAMLQQFFFTPHFCSWLYEIPLPLVQDAASASVDREAEASKSSAEQELVRQLQVLLANLQFSGLRFFDPAHFIHACKKVERQPRLLDEAHTQDDTMTFLEGLVDVLASVRGEPLDVFKVIEKERRWLEGSNDPRPIKANQREYLMLEIEEETADLQRALAKHFSKELMTGDNRIWNEATQSKETVWKQPFIEHKSLPEVLAIQLKRFKHTQLWDGSIQAQKLNTKVAYPLQLDVSDFVCTQTDDFSATPAPQGSELYELQGVIVHSGQTIHSGHYYSFVRRPGPEGGWFKIDDDVVSAVAAAGGLPATVLEESFGGTVESKDQLGDIKREARWRSAYVLFYRRAAAPTLWPAPLPAHLAPLRAAVEQHSLGAARRLLANDPGFAAAVQRILAALADALEPRPTAAAASAASSAAVPAAAQPAGAAATSTCLAAGGAGGAPRNGNGSNAPRAVGAIRRTGGASAAGPGELARAAEAAGIARLAAEACRLGALLWARVLAQKPDPGAGATALAAELARLLACSPSGARAFLSLACARAANDAPRAADGAQGGAARPRGARASWVEMLLVGHESAEVRGAMRTLVLCAARAVHRAAGEQGAPPGVEARGGEARGEAGAVEASKKEEGGDEVVDRCLFQLVQAMPAAEARWVAGAAGAAELDPWLDLLVLLAAARDPPAPPAGAPPDAPGGGFLASGRAAECAARELLALARRAAEAGSARGGLVCRAKLALERMLVRPEVEVALQQAPERWAWLCRWPEEECAAGADARPGAQLSAVLLRCAPDAPQLSPRDGDAPRVVVGGAGTARANGVYVYAGDVPGHGPAFARADGLTTWAIFPSKLRPSQALATLASPLKRQTLTMLEENKVEEVDAVHPDDAEMMMHLTPSIPANIPARLFRSVWWLLASVEDVVSWKEAARAAADALQHTGQLDPHRPSADGALPADGALSAAAQDAPAAAASAEEASAGAGERAGLAGLPAGLVVHYLSRAPCELPRRDAMELDPGTAVRVRVCAPAAPAVPAPARSDRAGWEQQTVQALERAAAAAHAPASAPASAPPAPPGEADAPVLLWGVVRENQGGGPMSVLFTDERVVTALPSDVDKVVGLPMCELTTQRGSAGLRPCPLVSAHVKPQRSPPSAAPARVAPGGVVDLTVEPPRVPAPADDAGSAFAAHAAHAAHTAHAALVCQLQDHISDFFQQSISEAPPVPPSPPLPPPLPPPARSPPARPAA